MKRIFPIAVLALLLSLNLQGKEPKSVPVSPVAEIDSPVAVKAAGVSKAESKRDRKGKTRTVPVIYYSILSKASGHCVAISEKWGGVAIEWTSRLAHDQQWRLKQVEGEWFQLVARHSDEALMVRDNAKYPVIQGNTSNGERSHWKLVSDSDGFVRIVNRTTHQFMGVVLNEGVHGAGVVLSEKADTDRQKWTLRVAEVNYVKEPLSKNLAIPASELIGKKHPKNTDELKEFLHGTTWSIRYGSPAGSEEYRMTFDKKGTLTLHYGRVSTLHFIGPKTIKLWNFDYAALSDQFNYFQAVDANGKVYYGVLLADE